METKVVYRVELNGEVVGTNISLTHAEAWKMMARGYTLVAIG